MSDTNHTDGTPSTPLYDQAAGSATPVDSDAVTGQGDPFDSVVAGTTTPGATGASTTYVAGTPAAGTGSFDSSSSDSGSGSGKADAAKGEAKAVAGDAKDSAQQVAGTAKEQAGKVASEATGQAKQLFGQATSELKDQAGAQQQKAAEGLHAVSQQLTSMADSSDNGLAQDIVRNLSGRAHGVASWLEGRDPGTLLDDVKHYAARKPGTFIAIAAASGLFAGRVVKALTAEAKSEHDSSSTSTGTASTTSAGLTSRTAPPTGDATITGPVAGEYDVVTEGDVPGFGTTTSSSTPGTFPGEGTTRP
jgi:uncharacterized protein YjbJ (UPF0337 family)